ncbi:MAG: hypothetical protein LW707_00860 [Sphingobacteriales bacterium]|nr:hypothetical protein [Sphingobacteriales bacterium]
MKKKIFKLLIYSAILLPFAVNAQLTDAYTEADRPYKDAWELYLKEKFGAARRGFEAYLGTGKGGENFKQKARKHHWPGSILAVIIIGISDTPRRSRPWKRPTSITYRATRYPNIISNLVTASSTRAITKRP